VEKQLIRSNLERIVKLAERMHIPANGEQVGDLARHALAMLERSDVNSMELGLIVAAFARSQRDSLAGPKTIPGERDLARWALTEAQKRYPSETGQMA
jgi:hypothetical protein